MDTIAHRNSWIHRYPNLAERGEGLLVILDPTCFPIGQAPNAYGQALQRALAGSHPSGVHLIRRLKPYAGGNNRLVQLHALDIVDKHRLVLIVGAAQKHVVVNFKMKVPGKDSAFQFPPIALNPADRQFPLTDGAEVFRVMAPARQSDAMPEHKLVFELARRCFRGERITSYRYT